MNERPEDWLPSEGALQPQGSINDAVRAFLRSPMPAPPKPDKPAEPWTPRITDPEEPTDLDAVIDGDPHLDFIGPEDGRWSVVAVPLADGTYAVAIGDGPQSPGLEPLPITLTEGIARGDHIRFFGRWATVQMVPYDVDSWPSGRMFVVDRYEPLRRR
jgi:hypothetical protein